MSFNKAHPELHEKEVFLFNCSEEDFRKLGWATKRLGTKAYDEEGSHVPDKRPVFVVEREFIGAARFCAMCTGELSEERADSLTCGAACSIALSNAHSLAAL